MNSYDSPGEINDNQVVLLRNMVTKGNSVVSAPGSVFYDGRKPDMSTVVAKIDASLPDYELTGYEEVLTVATH